MEEAYENGRKDLKLLIMKRKSTKKPKIYIKRKIYEVVIPKIRKLLMIKMKKVLLKLRKLFTKD